MIKNRVERGVLRLTLLRFQQFAPPAQLFYRAYSHEYAADPPSPWAFSLQHKQNSGLHRSNRPKYEIQDALHSGTWISGLYQVE